MRATNRRLRVALSGVLLWAGVAIAAPTAGATEFDLHEISSDTALPAVRTLADPDKLERVDGNTLRVRGTPAQLELAAAVVELVDGKGLGDSTRATGDGTVVARYDLKGVSSRNAIRHLRTMSIRQVVHVSEVSALLVSGSEEQIEAATLRMKVLRQENTAR